jgi:hypothetical protein
MRLGVLRGGLAINICFVFDSFAWWGSLGVVEVVRRLDDGWAAVVVVQSETETILLFCFLKEERASSR